MVNFSRLFVATNLGLQLQSWRKRPLIHVCVVLASRNGIEPCKEIGLKCSLCWRPLSRESWQNVPKNEKHQTSKHFTHQVHEVVKRSRNLVEQLYAFSCGGTSSINLPLYWFLSHFFSSFRCLDLLWLQEILLFLRYGKT